ncbi:OmpA/MotB family protein [Aquimarina sp. 2201CG14-23]|uniref:OmpA/MotB family protein n=1 Tax=Aquimarina mycalae TaxID=3040073 RepID=UPI0024780136|nr:OmpA family protein [Aquimarina sp. 2201CG14-23]MDH7448327.1 OmpA family protein [Aquimarina sp. 2201CG14-23]
MRKIILFASVLLVTNSFVHAQKKKDLIAEIDLLRKELKTTKGELTESRKNEKVSEAQVKSMETQVNDLKETNASLLANMNSFTELSNKKASNLQKSQEIIKAKDDQLNAINDAITANDSINLAVFSTFKNAIGGDQIKISNGTIYIVLPNTTLFGENDKNYIVDPKAKPTLEKIAATLNANPNLKITVEGNSNALKLDGKKLIDNWDLSARQAASIVRVLQSDYKVDPKRMEALGKSEYATEGIETVTRIIIDPKFDQFYGLVKDNMKK